MNDTLKNQIAEFAREDIQIAIDNGQVNIADTKLGLIEIHSLGTTVQAYNNRAEQLTGPMNVEQMVVWLSNTYQIEG
tara:strand:+ start:633 stop:863 length:231 start_codon:yes stop_codon:yes gene_type:complete